MAFAASDFDYYLRDVHGGRDESARALTDHLRKDDWGQPAVASMRAPMRGGNNNSHGYQQQAQYRQQQQRFAGRGTYQAEPSFDDIDPFQESKHPTLPNEADSFKRPSPDARDTSRLDRSGYNDFGGPPSNTPSPFGGAGGQGQVGRAQTPQDGRRGANGTAHFEESVYKMESANNSAVFDEFDPRSIHGQGRESLGRMSAY